MENKLQLRMHLLFVVELVFDVVEILFPNHIMNFEIQGRVVGNLTVYISGTFCSNIFLKYR